MIVLGIFLVLGGCAKKQQVPAEQPITAPAPEVSREGEIAPAPAPEALAGCEDIHFDFDKYNIRSDAREVLSKNYAMLKGMKNAKVLVEGHCDERGTEQYNMALGQKRADSTRDYLISLGMDASQLGTISYGKDRPLCPDHNEDCWAKNRRAHFVLSE
jgi:peptidoglycan-associated lipoprotein